MRYNEPPTSHGLREGALAHTIFPKSLAASTPTIFAVAANLLPHHSRINLKSFVYCGELRHKYSLDNSSSLVEADITLHNTRTTEFGERARLFSYAHELLKPFYNVKSLKLCAHTIQVLSGGEELMAQMPIFHNLTSLKILGQFYSFNLSHGRALMNILQNSPCLSSFGLHSPYCEANGWIMDPVPSCFLTHLKTIMIYSFNATKLELHPLKILLKNAKVLEKLVIYCHIYPPPPSNAKLQSVKKRLLRFPKASTSCEITIEVLSVDGKTMYKF